MAVCEGVGVDIEVFLQDDVWPISFKGVGFFNCKEGYLVVIRDGDTIAIFRDWLNVQVREKE